MSSDRPVDDPGSPYDTLGVGADATDTEITRVYRRLARERHPDTASSGAGDTFAELTDAYDTLRDPVRRRAYDDTRRSRNTAAAAAAGVRIPVHHHRAGPSSPLGPPAAPGRTAGTQPAEIELPVTFDQAALGTTAVVSIEGDHACEACAGSGHGRLPPPRCGDCDGSGMTTRRSGGITIRAVCPRCGGAGHATPPSCRECGGTGTRHGHHETTVRVPAGVQDGTRLRLPLPGGRAVTAVVRVSGHPYFTRVGDDIALRLPVTLAEATLGAVVTVPTLDGAVAIRIPPGTPPGRTMRIRGRGIPHRNGPGDLLVTIDVVIPTDLNPSQRAALEAFAAATPSPRRHLERPEHEDPSPSAVTSGDAD